MFLLQTLLLIIVLLSFNVTEFDEYLLWLLKIDFEPCTFYYFISIETKVFEALDSFFLFVYHEEYALLIFRITEFELLKSNIERIILHQL
jgi:hypothetical protein